MQMHTETTVWIKHLCICTCTASLISLHINRTCGFE